MKLILMIAVLLVAITFCSSEEWFIYSAILNSSHEWSHHLKNSSSAEYKEKERLIETKLTESYQDNYSIIVVSFEKSHRVLFSAESHEELNATLEKMKGVWTGWRSKNTTSIFTGPPKRKQRQLFHTLQFFLSASGNSSSDSNSKRYLKCYMECLYSSLNLTIKVDEIKHNGVWVNLAANKKIRNRSATRGALFNRVIFPRLRIVELHNSSQVGSVPMHDAWFCSAQVTITMPQSSTAAYRAVTAVSSNQHFSKPEQTSSNAASEVTTNNVTVESHSASTISSSSKRKSRLLPPDLSLNASVVKFFADNVSPDDVRTNEHLSELVEDINTEFGGPLAEEVQQSDLESLLDLLSDVEANFEKRKETISPDLFQNMADMISSFTGSTANNNRNFIHRAQNVLEKYGSLTEIPDNRDFLTVRTSLFDLKVKNVVPDKDITVHVRHDRDSTPNISVNIPKSALSGILGTARIMVTAFRNMTAFHSAENLEMAVSVKVDQKQFKNLQHRITINFVGITASHGKKAIGNSHKTLKTSLKCVYYDEGSNRWSTRGCFLKTETSTPACEVDHLTNFAIIANSKIVSQDVALMIVSKIGCGLSIIGLFITIALYLHSKKWIRNRPGLEMLHVCFNLIMVYTIFLAGVEPTGTRTACIATTAALQYFYLVTWSWIGIYARDMYISLVRVYSEHPTNFLAKATCLAYGLPFLLVALHATIATVHFDALEDNTIMTVNGPEYEDSVYFAESYCWLHSYSLYFGFLLPVGLVLLHNLRCFAVIIYEIAWKAESLESSAKKKSTMVKLRLAIIVGILVGVTWIFGFLLLISENETYLQVMSWLFALFNSTQGFSMFVILCVKSKDIRDSWWTPLKKKLRIERFCSSHQQKNFSSTRSTVPLELSRRDMATDKTARA